jgi:predicted acylesterase/phospholipase RssA
MNKPKIGLAFSGGSGRAIAQAGVLDVFEENSIPVDVITAYSSGALIAAAYAGGKLKHLLNDWLNIKTNTVYRMFELNDKLGGIFGMDKFTEWFETYCSDENMEDMHPKLGFVAVDLEAREPLLLSIGNLKRALQATCAVPGLFEPVRWGSKLLVDGGLMSAIPGAQAKSMGADIVIGVNVLKQQTMFTKRTINMWRKYTAVKNSLLFRPVRYAMFRLDKIYKKYFAKMFSDDYGFFAENAAEKNLHVFEVLRQSMNIAMDQESIHMRPAEGCDILLRPDGIYLDRIGVKETQKIYEAGRAAALEALPEIKRLISEFK